MKRFSSILLAALVATLMLVSNVRAQQVVVAAGDWQNALATWNTPTFPGQLNDNTIAQTGPAAPAAITLTNAGGIANRVRALQVQGGTNLILQGTGSLLIGALNLNAAASVLTIGPGLNVVIDSVIDGSAGSTIVVQAGGTLTLRRGTNAPTSQVLLGGTLLAASVINGSVVIENGFNGGEFPTNLFYAAPPAVGTAMAYLGAITVVGNTALNENVATPALGGIFTVNGGVLQVAAGATLQLGQTGANSLQGTGTLNAVVGGTINLAANFSANIVPGQRFSNPFNGTLQVNTPMTLNSNMTFSPPNPTTAQQSVLNLAAGSLTVPAGVTLTMNNTINNALQGAAAANVVIVNAGATVVLGNGFNAGIIPSARFSTINGTLQTVGPMGLNVTGALVGGMFSSSGQFEIGGDLSLAGAGTLEFSQTGPNSVRATTGSNARIIAPGRNTGVQFNANANNGVLPGCLLGNPFSGFVTIRSSMNLSCDLFMATDGGAITFNNNTAIAPAPAPSIILTIQSNVTLALRQNVATFLTARTVTAPGTALIDPLTSYIQGVNNTSRLILGLGANGGTVPTGAAAGTAPTIPFLPLSGFASFNGRLVLEGSLTLATNLEMGTGSILDLAGGNLTVQDTRVLRLSNSGSNSLIGTGVIQAVAPPAATPANGANFYAQVGPQGTAATRGSLVEIGPSMNGTIFPAARFASPFQGNIDFSTAGTLTVQGDFVHGIPGGRGYFVVGAITSNANITIAANSSVRLNTINPSSFYGSAVVIPPVPAFPGGSFQGVNQTSRLVIGVGHANENNAFAVTTTGSFLANPFNGTLAFASNTIIYTSATIGVTGGLELGGYVQVTSGTRYGATGVIPTSNSGHNRQHPMTSPLGTIPYINGITITLNNQAANSISGLGVFQTATANTVVFGSGANGGIIPGNRLASPHFGTIATVGAMTLQGNLTIGDLRDGHADRIVAAAIPATAEYLSSGFLKLGDQLTIDNAAVLSVSNATAQPFSTRYGGNADAFQVSTNGTGRIQALANGELRLLDGFNARNLGGNSAFTTAVSGDNGVGLPTVSSNRLQASNYIPTQSFFHPGFLASPFNGKLFIGSDMPQDGAATLANRNLAGGFSRFNITTGTLNIGATGFLGLISPLYVSSGTAVLAVGATPATPLTDGYPRVILGMTGANSFVGTTTGSFLQSSTGNFNSANTLARFIIGALHSGTTGGSINLVNGFNGGIIPGSLFGNPFSGRIVMPQTGTLTLTGNLIMNTGTPSPNLAGFLAGNGVPATSPAGDYNYGILHLGVAGATSVLQIQDGSSLQLGTTGSLTTAAGQQNNQMVFANGLGPNGTGISLPGTVDAPLAATAPQGQGTQSFRALQGAGTIQGLGNNARVVIPGTMNDGFVTGANFAVPFNGRMVIQTSANMYLVGNLTFGAVGSSLGVLDIQPTPVILGANAPLFVPVGSGAIGATPASLANGSSITFNNISPVSVALPGAGAIVSTSNFARIIIGPDALANVLPAAQLRSPFVGQLIVTSGSASVTPSYAMAANLLLAQDGEANTIALSAGAPGLRNGYLRTFRNIVLGSNVSLDVANISKGTLSGTGTIGATDVSSVVRFRNHFGFGGNDGKIGTMVGPIITGGSANPATMTASLYPATVETAGFADPFLGTIQTDIAQASVGSPVLATAAAGESSRNVYHLFGRVTLGAPGTPNGIFNSSGATVFVAAGDQVPFVAANANINSTVGNLVINNTSPLAVAFPGAGRVTPKGLSGAVAVPVLLGNPAPMSGVAANAGLNGSIVFGPGALGGTFPGDRFTSAAAVGTAIAGDQRLDGAAVWGAEVRGTIMTSTGSLTATAANLTFANGGTLLVGGPDLRYGSATLSEQQRPTAVVSTNNTLAVPAGTVYTVTTPHRSAFGGNGALILGATTASLVYGVPVAPFVGLLANEGVLYGEHVGVNNVGQLTFNAITDLRGTLRHGRGGRNEATIAFPIGLLTGIVIGTNATLDLRLQTARVTLGLAAGLTAGSSLIRSVGTATNLSNNTSATSSVLIFGPDYGRFANNAGAGAGEVDRFQGNINQDLPLLSNVITAVSGPVGTSTGFGGTVITSTGSIAVTTGNLGLQGALEMGGILNVAADGAARTVVLQNTGANTFRATAGSNGHLRANPDGLAFNTRIVLGPNLVNGDPATVALSSFNGGVLPANLFGRSDGSNAANGLPIDGIRVNTFGATRGTATLDINSSRLTLSGGDLYMYGDLNFTAFGGDLAIPANTTLTINGGFAQAAGTRRGVITGANNTSVLAIAPAARLNGVGGIFAQTDNTLDANSPQIGNRGVAPANGAGFTGTLRLLTSGFDESLNNTYPVQTHWGNPVSNLGISGITVTIATAGILDMQSTRSSIVLRNATARLNLNNTPAGSFMPSLVALQGSSNKLRVATTSIVSLSQGVGAATGAATNAIVSLGAGFNGGIVPGTLLSSYNLQAGPQYIMNSNLNLGSEMFVATSGTWNFTANSSNKLTLGDINMTVNGAVANASSTAYFVTNGAGTLGLGQVGNVTFPVGPSAAIYAPIIVSNNALPSLFGVRVSTPVTRTLPLASAAPSTVRAIPVNLQWSVEQRTNIAAGIAVVITPQWPATSEGAGFSRPLTSVNRYDLTNVLQSSTPAVANPVNGLANYFQSTLVVTQTGTPLATGLVNGQLNAQTAIVVTSAPTANLISFTPAAAASTQTVTIVGQRFAGVTAVRFGGVNAASFTVSNSGDTIRAVVGPGGATGLVTVVQPAGTATSAQTFTFLGAPAQTPVIINALPAPIPAGLGDFAINITGTGFGSNTLRVNVAGSGLQGVVVPTSNSATAIALTVPGQFTRNVGTITLTVTSLDKNPVSTTVTVAVAPATTLTTLSPSTTTGNLQAFTVGVTGTAFGPQSVFSLNGTSLRLISFTSNPNGTLTALVEIPAGAVSGNVTVTNLNNTTAALPFAFTNLPRPLIASVTPTAISPGSPTTRITVNGQNFIPGATVTFNGITISPVTTSSIRIDFDVPASLLANPDLATILITNPDRQSIGYRFPVSIGGSTAPNFATNPGTLVPAPGVITPSSTNATGQAFQITLNGNTIATNATVSIGGVSVPVISNNGTRLVVNVPGNLNIPGMVIIQVANGPNAVTNLTYNIGPSRQDPAITRVVLGSPNTTITGDNFFPGATVQIGSTPLTVVSVSTNVIVAVTPRLPNGTYTLVVTNPDGRFATQPVVITSVKADPLAATRVYPNPTVDVVNIEATLDRAATVVINVTNTLGQQVMTVRQTAQAGFFTKSLNVSNLPTGAYTIEITDGTRRSVEKIIKN